MTVFLIFRNSRLWSRVRSFELPVHRQNGGAMAIAAGQPPGADYSRRQQAVSSLGISVKFQNVQSHASFVASI
ncbi:MAG: hypothetical protein KatS3mg112_1242 [Thermogutta sp.]|nr:MAG: hypothetical protein KatS3mg112_1242 [Thermogutta sp.]